MDGIAVGFERRTGEAGVVAPRAANLGRSGQGPKALPHSILSAFDGAILPRLRQRYGAPRRAAPAHDVETFTQLLIEADERAAAAFAEAWATTATTEQLALDLLAPSARRLGRMWEDDSADFLAVTIGLGRLTALADRFFAMREGASAHGGRVRLSAAPGETHVFGVRLLASFYRAAGWHVEEADATGVVHGAWGAPWDVVGYSIGSRCNLKALRAEIAAARRRLPASTQVFVGGPLVAVEPGIAHFLGADAAFFDAPTAVQASNALLRGDSSM